MREGQIAFLELCITVFWILDTPAADPEPASRADRFLTQYVVAFVTAKNLPPSLLDVLRSKNLQNCAESIDLEGCILKTLLEF